jgi:hypothetical protein
MSHSRRHFLQRGAAFSLGVAGLGALFRSGRVQAALVPSPDVGFGDLLPDPQKLLDLPAGFSYVVLSRQGETMDDGLLVPGKHDGMAAFPGPPGKTILVRNHEIERDWFKHGAFGLTNERLASIPKDRFYDFGEGKTPGLGGTTTLLVDTASRKVEKHFLSLAGTSNHCAGGPTPWGSWLTCEEITLTKGGGVEKDHGFVFEVPATASAPVDPVPLSAMGRFRHEAVAIDPASGCVYQTEDLADGVLYRFIPKVPGKLIAGGRLQALVARDRHQLDAKNWKEPVGVRVGEVLPVKWIELANVLAPDDDLRHQAASRGAVRFARCEGMWHGRGAVFFAATTGGVRQLGQIWKYTPSPAEGTPAEDKHPASLELLIEPNDSAVCRNADNVTVAPWGDLICCEDDVAESKSKTNRLFGVTPDGKPYLFAANRLNSSEFAGATFSPDGSTLFVNIQNPGMTLAIQGPWRNA